MISQIPNHPFGTMIAWRPIQRDLYKSSQQYLPPPSSYSLFRMQLQEQISARKCGSNHRFASEVQWGSREVVSSTTSYNKGILPPLQPPTSYVTSQHAETWHAARGWNASHLPRFSSSLSRKLPAANGRTGAHNQSFEFIENNVRKYYTPRSLSFQRFLFTDGSLTCVYNMQEVIVLLQKGKFPKGDIWMKYQQTSQQFCLFRTPLCRYDTFFYSLWQ